MKSYLITGATLINEEKRFQKDVLIEEGRIKRIDDDLSRLKVDRIIEAEGQYLLPGRLTIKCILGNPG